VSEVSGVLSVFDTLSGRAPCSTLSEDAGEAPVVLSEAGACPEVARGTIKRLNPSSDVARKVECRDITALRFKLCATLSFLMIKR
jgi:hypothetical protein